MVVKPLSFDNDQIELTIDLLKHEDTSWVWFKSKVYLSYLGKMTEVSGLWNYLFDIYVFWLKEEGPQIGIISDGSMDEIDWTIVKNNATFLEMFTKVYKDVGDVLENILERDKLNGFLP